MMLINFISISLGKILRKVNRYSFKKLMIIIRRNNMLMCLLDPKIIMFNLKFKLSRILKVERKRRKGRIRKLLKFFKEIKINIKLFKFNRKINTDRHQ